jgi:hypothetical protein
MEKHDMNTAGNESTSEFEDFVSAGKVEVGSEVAAEKEAAEEAPKRRDPPKTKAEPEPEAEDADDIEVAGEEGADGDEGDEEPEPKPKRLPSDRIRELTKKLRERDRLLETTLSRIENLEKGLSGENQGGNQDSGKPEPDASDTDKYPLGHLDDRYIEDKLEWLSEKKATERADAVLQRQQEYEQAQAAQAQQQDLLVKVDELAVRGIDLYDDFQESVVEAGMKGDWDLSQATFEAAHEADNGAQILYELSQDQKEASRVAKLSPYQQLKFVQARDAEITQGKTPRRIPKAGDPPRNVARGANSRTHISPATENLDDFEKAWQADAKRGHS